ncbi:iron-sulfur cluster insertion protein ErpA [Halopseudomonas aestusnigri]|jgi:iron-sulfur cluster insertion protein|uniref:iron-sulfur cluster insertion protein ErpA n=1 Tax=Halopseudomonas TaxID=2901189 RepID=UPI000C60FB6C|nr:MULTISPECIES: iron-sulfur cluster insertion protein ErpA [Halopseudomonas]MAG99242.1 iron-sulfur cluster insertion protein ErpA [Pseudomonadales bacterium]MEE2798550.1 iron-sulfur cluster insertion protein ErpA [Pseudomonadota bacterium]HBT58318.1 iron-sulfur cluster insertion protein ErpA [Pseudomonas sp.]MAK73417.1 iron-sulfur cluster insertion protein ErpA [Pseudomonadales bacterium]MAP75639.1 iron-sulfur cluster insertion protein ErpA [Pseudomonadales bacterium]|tara:strand:- start:625 stop:975 length:351 start_codon:yes stop_codon:yes gene_type:complete
MSAEVFVPSPLIFSDNAVSKVRSLIEEEGNDSLSLRVFVTGGGCSGFQYGFTFDDELAEDDTVVERDGVRLVVDPMSFQYLVGSEVDYQEGLEGSRFVINNPNASTTCGCGSSFSI